MAGGVSIAMKPNLTPSLQAIYDLELALGNQVAQVRESSHPVLPLAIIFMKPLHRAEVEAKIPLGPSVKWYGIGSFSGYVCENTRESLQGPTPPLAELVRTALGYFAPNLRAIYDLELSLGNSVNEVDEPAGDRCPLAIIFKHPMHKGKIESALSVPTSVKWWECHDTHYAVQGGYICEETRHVIAGPLM